MINHLSPLLSNDVTPVEITQITQYDLSSTYAGVFNV